jgi:Predicted membrane protein (DUF2127)
VHGAVKVVLVVAQLLNKLWAYPCMIIVLLIFIGYQLYRIVLQPGAGLIALTVFDAGDRGIDGARIPQAAADPERPRIRQRPSHLGAGGGRVRKPATGRPVASGDVASPMTSRDAGPSWSPWRTVVGFGVVSLAVDMVYEGARSVTGPLLASLGASAVLVGLVSGAGEAMALLLRLVFGPWADRSGRYWTLTFAGYALTAVCVSALAIYTVPHIIVSSFPSPSPSSAWSDTGSAN